MLCKFSLFFACIVCIIPVPDAAAQPRPIELSVDATEAPRRLLHAKMKIPVSAGPLTLYYPKWIPGEHSPSGRSTIWPGSSSTPAVCRWAGGAMTSISTRFIAPSRPGPTPSRSSSTISPRKRGRRGSPRQAPP